VARARKADASALDENMWMEVREWAIEGVLRGMSLW
jgi:hypothetical protein